MTNTHYKQTDLEPIEVINKWELNFCLGNVIKYIGRAKHKGTELEDLEKAADYLRMEIERVKGLQPIKGAPQPIEPIKIKVVKCSVENSWHGMHIGYIYNVDRETETHYVVLATILIPKEDCEIITDQPQQTTKKVRIVKCEYDTGWYKDKIGQCIDVVEWGSASCMYKTVIGNNTLYVIKSDCELLYTMQDLIDNKIAVKVHSAEEAERLGVDFNYFPTCYVRHKSIIESRDEIYWHHLDYLIINSNQVITE